MHEPGDVPAGPGPDLQTEFGPISEAAPIPQRLSQRTGAAADTAAPPRAGTDDDGGATARSGGSSDPSDAPHDDAEAPLGGASDTSAPERRTGLATGPEQPKGPERLRQEAFETAWRFLAHRERTEAELVARLERNDVTPELIAEVLDELRQGGYVDDAGFARRFVEDKRNLDGWGAERIERRLIELGIDRQHIRAALAHDDEHDELAAATALLQGRFPTPPETPRELERALGFLVRKGYELELAHDALRRHGALALEDSPQNGGALRAVPSGTTIRRSDRPGPHGPLETSSK